MSNKQLLKPSDCLIGFSIPHNKKSFYKNYRSGRAIDFTRQVVWPCYELDTVRPSQSLFRYFTQLDVMIQYEFTFTHFRQFFRDQGKHRLLILFAHWKDDHIEFFDGITDLQRIKNAIPLTSELILDLNVCKCDNLHDLLKKEHHYLTIKANRGRDCYPIFWLRFYKYFFQYIHDYDVTLNEAYEHCIPTFFNYIKNENN